MPTSWTSAWLIIMPVHTSAQLVNISRAKEGKLASEAYPECSVPLQLKAGPFAALRKSAVGTELEGYVLEGMCPPRLTPRSLADLAA